VPLAAFPKCYLDALLVERTMTVETWIDLAAEHLDVDGLELYSRLIADRSDGELAALRTHIESRGLAMPMMCHSPDFTLPDVDARRREVERQRAAIRMTAALGGRWCRVLSGQSRPGMTRDQGLERAVACIEAVLPDAAEHGVVLILENHYKDGAWERPEFAQRRELFLELLERLGDQPWLGINFDPSNALIAGEDPLELLDAVKHRVVTMHASDRYLEGGTLEDLRRVEADPKLGYSSLLRHGVIGEGLNDYDRIFATLHAAGFRGWISIEDGAEPEGGLERLQRSARFLRAKMAEHGLP
jgi:sugar phosphate isomerase/epimerase